MELKGRKSAFAVNGISLDSGIRFTVDLVYAVDVAFAIGVGFTTTIVVLVLPAGVLGNERLEGLISLSIVQKRDIIGNTVPENIVMAEKRLEELSEATVDSLHH